MNAIFYTKLTNFLKKRASELAGLFLIGSCILLAISFISYSPNDPSLVYDKNINNIENYFGIYGSLISDFLLQSFGLLSFLLLATIFSWGFALLIKKKINSIVLKIFFLILYLIFGCTFIYITYNNSFWLIDNGNAGFVGRLIYDFSLNFFIFQNSSYIKFLLIFLTITFFILSSEINLKKILLI